MVYMAHSNTRASKQHFHLEDQDNAVIDSGLLVLGYALSYPHDIPDLLLPEPHVRKEDPVVELLLKCEDQTPHLLLIEHLVKHLSFPKAHLQSNPTLSPRQLALKFPG